MINNFSKRILTSSILLMLLSISLFIDRYLWFILILVVSIISFHEFNNLINKTYKKRRNLIYTINIITFFYFIFFIYTTYLWYDNFDKLIFILLVCILSDTGGYIVGKVIGGKKLTKISPNKTIAGSIGSFVFSLFPIFFFLIIYQPTINSYYYDSDMFILIYESLFLSFVCQIGDLFISYFKRKAKVKDTGSILPGHGGILDRIDGAIFVIPVAFIISELFLK